MKQRILAGHRQSLTRPEPYLRFLKPGALAQLRDSRINSRSHRVNTLPQFSPNRSSPPASPSPNARPLQANTFVEFPCFAGRIYGPRCPQRKKLVAAKDVLFVRSRPVSPVLGSTDPIINGLNNDSAVIAH